MRLFAARLTTRLLVSLVAAAAVIASCSTTPVVRHADVIVVGAGIAGLSAALEASANGARVILIDANSVGGGHAVKAGGFALVDTALQRARGIEDSPELAFADWALRGDDPDTYWAWRYAQESAAEVYDWLTEAGAEFKILLPTPEDRVPRFHFTAGTAVNVVVPLLRKVLYDTRIDTLWNTRAVALIRTSGRISGVKVSNERSGQEALLRANAVVLTTGGLQGDPDAVLAHWWPDRSTPERLLAGGGHFATGDGYRMADWAGAELQNMEKQEIFHNGVPDPRDPTGTRGLVAQNNSAIWVDDTGRRFMDESQDSRAVRQQLEKMGRNGYWMIFDAAGARRFSMRDAPWLNRETVRREVLDNPRIVHKANSIRQLATLAGLPQHGLQTTIETWNRMIEFQEDFQYGRFHRATFDARTIRAIKQPPYYAVRTYALTRKSMGGPMIDPEGRVLNAARQPIPGLYAAGELTGVAGINGSYGGAGTFLGPSVFTGRIAGRGAATHATAAVVYADLPQPASGNAPAPGAPGYWHFNQAHALVSERGYTCDRCHSATNPMQASADRAVQLARLDSCTLCH